MVRDGWPAGNLLGWPRDVPPFELAAETLRGELDACGLAGCSLAGGHSVDNPDPEYGPAVTGTANPNRLLRNDSGRRDVGEIGGIGEIGFTATKDREASICAMTLCVASRFTLGPDRAPVLRKEE